MSWFTRFFIPHRDNEYKPRVLERAAVFGMLLMVLLSFAITNIQSFLWMTSEYLVSTILPAVIVTNTNDERADAALPPLLRSETLDAAAALKAKDMAAQEYFAHYSPTGVSPWHWFDEAGYVYVHAGENLAVHFTDSDEVVEAWMDSPTHRANIMNGNYQEIGIGTARGEYQGFPTVFVVQLFGTRQAVAVASSPQVVAIEAETSTVLPQEVLALETPESPTVAGIEEVREIAELSLSDVVSSEAPSVTVMDNQNQTEVVVAEESSTPLFENIEVFDDTVVAYSDHLATSVPGIPVEPAITDAHNESTPVLGTLTRPHVVLETLYGILATFVFLALLSTILIEVRRQQPLQVVRGVGLMVLMVLLLYTHLMIGSGAFIV